MGNRRCLLRLEKIFRLYAFSSFNLLPRILKKIALDQAGVLLIALGCGLKRLWFPHPLSLLVGLIIPRYFHYLRSTDTCVFRRRDFTTEILRSSCIRTHNSRSFLIHPQVM